MSITWDKRNQAYRFHFNRIIGGKQCRATKILEKGFSREQADDWDEKESARIVAQVTGIAPRDKPTIATCVDLYVKHHLPSLKTSRAISQELLLIADDIGETLLEDIGSWTIKMREIAATRQQKRGKGKRTGWSPATLLNRLAYVRSAINYACKFHAAEVGQDMGYAKRMTLPVVKNQRDLFIDFDTDLPKLLEKMRDDEMKALVMFMCYTGTRWRSELLNSTIRQESLYVEDTKNGTKLYLPLHPELAPWMSFLPFTSMHSRNYYKLFKQGAKRAGFGWLTAHMLRHSLAARLIGKGATLAQVAEVLNHASINSTWRYKHLVTAGKRATLAMA